MTITAAAPTTDQAAVTIPIVLARELRDEPLPLSLLDLPPPDLGIAGAKLAITDNNTTGRFMDQKFNLDIVEEADAAKLIQDVVQKVDAGAHFILVDAKPDTLLKLADALHGKEALLINYSAPDDRLREEDCRPQVLHTAPTRSMLADALAYLVWKKWPRWLLVLSRENDKLLADALRRSAKRFGAKIVEAHLQYKPAAALDGGSSRSSSRSPRSRKARPTTMSSSSPTKATCSATTCPTGRGMRDPLPALRVSCRRAGTRQSSCGAAPSSRTGSSGLRAATCARSTTMSGWPCARSARRRPARIRRPLRTSSRI
jgi:hypothetical protein